MEGIKEGGCITRPPLLDGTNYPYWKEKMTTFLKLLDTKTWKAVLTGGTSSPQVNNKGVVVVKEEVEWSTVKKNCP
ncbi:hypothetical protein LIER_29347 [Lithospermum erythrorhizon]|uniref:Gag-pol polyprotein n=1 Tax=Lithospermum erythrorhizon TaxID=34254 RepID=A0AAV3RMH3_LITER